MGTRMAPCTSTRERSQNCSLWRAPSSICPDVVPKVHAWHFRMVARKHAWVLTSVHLQFQRNYTHQLEVHDMGLYRLKGLAHDVQLKSLNVAALRGRNVLFEGGTKTAKAARVQAGVGLEKVSTVRVSVSATALTAPVCVFRHSGSHAARNPDDSYLTRVLHQLDSSRSNVTPFTTVYDKHASQTRASAGCASGAAVTGTCV